MQLAHVNVSQDGNWQETAARSNALNTRESFAMDRVSVTADMEMVMKHTLVLFAQWMGLL